ncbi:hypothetical protein AB0H43_30715 [Hamadaea sp. NPDC050747]|uniref:hypothetical protein n=1 Tax=Hamadaea sp. NPDC050747 TaxID=3155789 RepID=UPI0033C0943D
MSAIAYEAPRARKFAALADSLWVLRQAGVVFGRHWPVLITLALTGVAAHDLILEGAVRAALVDSTLGLVVIVLAPIATLTSLVYMLRVVRVSLPHLDSEPPAIQGGAEPPPTMLDFIGSVAVPYLAIYSAYGYMKEDFTRFAYEVWRNDPFSTLDHLPFSPTVGIISVVAVAVVLRFLLGRLRRRRSLRWTAAIGAYVEVIWVATLVWGVNTAHNSFDDWFGQRQVGTWVHDALEKLPGTQIASVLSSWSGVLWENADLVFLAPIAWLTMGAVVYGRSIEEPKLTDERILTATARRMNTIPVVKSFANPLSAELHKRFGPLLGGLRMLARAGLRPMLLFCLVFVLLQSADAGLWELERLLIGPQDLQEVWWPVSYLLSPINTAIRFVLLICLLGAATDRILRSREAS